MSAPWRQTLCSMYCHTPWAQESEDWLLLRFCPELAVPLETLLVTPLLSHPGLGGIAANPWTLCQGHSMVFWALLFEIMSPMGSLCSWIKLLRTVPLAWIPLHWLSIKGAAYSLKKIPLYPRLTKFAKLSDGWLVWKGPWRYPVQGWRTWQTLLVSCPAPSFHFSTNRILILLRGRNGPRQNAYFCRLPLS